MGEVHVIAEIVPKTVRLWGTPEEDIAAEAVITPAPDVPFEIVGAHADNAADFQFEFKKRKHQYVLSIRNTKKTVGRYWGRVYLETDLDGGPEITVTVHGNIYATPGKTTKNKS